MIKAIFLDFYNTLVQFWPPLDQIQQASCREMGLTVSAEGIDRGYAVADVFFNRENEIRPLAERSEGERSEFFAHYEQMILENAGVPVSLDLAGQIWKLAISVPKDFIPYDDVIPALTELHQQGYQLAVLSNLRRDMSELCQRLGLAPYLDFYVSSAEVGAEKPHAAVFLAALEKAEVAPGEVVHVGDQLRSDVVGARGVGIHPVLLDRGGWHQDIEECARIESLAQLQPLLVNAPRSLTSGNGQSPSLS